VPYDVRGSSDLTSIITPASHLARFFFWNHINDAEDLPTPGDGAPNPSSESGFNPAANLFNHSPRYVWKSKGLFRIRSTIQGWCFLTPNNRIKMQDPGGTATVAMTTSDYTDPRDLANEIQTKLNADGTLTGTYSVSYRDERTTGFTVGDSANYKWTVACTTSFAMRASTGTMLVSLGYVGPVTPSSLSHTATYRACHTEEFLIFKLRNIYNNLWDYQRPVIDNTNCSDLSSYRHVIIENSNIQEFGGGTNAEVFPAIYLSSNSSFDVTNTTWTEGLNKISFGPRAAGYGVYRDSYVWHNATNSISYFWAVDLCKYNNRVLGSSLGGFDQEYLKIRVHDPRSESGHVQIGSMYCGPAWYPSRNFNISWTDSRIEPSPSYRTDQGVTWRRAMRGYSEAQLQWTAENPMPEREYAEFFYRIASARADSQTYTSSGSLRRVPNTAIGADARYAVRNKPFIFTDPTFNSGYPKYGTSAGITKAMRRMTFVDAPQGEQLEGVDLWAVSMNLREDT